MELHRLKNKVQSTKGGIWKIKSNDEIAGTQRLTD